MRAAGKFARLLFVSGMLSNSKEDAKDMSKLDVRLFFILEVVFGPWYRQQVHARSDRPPFLFDHNLVVCHLS